jgi:hypothetical protein
MMFGFDTRQYAPATQRNREPILEILQQVLPPTGTVLEISSGTGEHAVFLAPRLAPRRWLPSDPNPVALASIAAWQKHLPSPNLQPPIALDVRNPVWGVEQDLGLDESSTVHLKEPITAIVNINMIHIAPWEACLGLMAGARRILPLGGILYLYGPFKQGGIHTAPSNATFDESLRQQNAQWGVRDLEAVVAAAAAERLSLIKTFSMPANNLSVLFQA